MRIYEVGDMRIYVAVQHSERSAYIARQIRRWVRRSFRLADFILNAIIGASVFTGAVLACLVDGMDEVLFLKMTLGCVIIGGIAVMLKAAIEPELKRKPRRRINRTA